MVVQNSGTPVPEDLAIYSDLCKHQAHVWYTAINVAINVDKTLIHIK